MGYVSGIDVNPILDSLMEKAYALDSLDASVELGYAAHLTWREFKWDEAEIHFKRSIEINPNASISHAAFAHYLMIRNRWDDAWEQMDYAIELDPQNPWVVAFSAAVFYHDGKLLSAAKNSERLIRIAPNHPMANEMLLGKYIFQKKYDQAIIELKKYVGRTNAPRLNAVIDEAYRDNNFDQSVKSTAAYLEKYSVDHFVSPEIIHTLYQFIGDNEKQLDWMMKMYEVGDGNLPYCAVRNDDPIQQDPRYQLIMKEIGLW